MNTLLYDINGNVNQIFSGSDFSCENLSCANLNADGNITSTGSFSVANLVSDQLQGYLNNPKDNLTSLYSQWGSVAQITSSLCGILNIQGVSISANTSGANHLAIGLTHPNVTTSSVFMLWPIVGTGAGSLGDPALAALTVVPSTVGVSGPNLIVDLQIANSTNVNFTNVNLKYFFMIL
jgi:hypothetical protein